MSAGVAMKAQHVSKTFGQGAREVHALSGVTLEIHRGEMTLLMGPSGSGKTTLLSILGCILSASTGEIWVAGNPTAGLSPERLAALRRRYLGFVFQSYNLFPTLTATENVLLALKVRGFEGSEADQFAASALAEVGLSDKQHANPGILSGGQQQRLAIARALAGNPAILLADEPTAALDTENGAAVMGLLAGLAKKNDRAVLAVTHDPRTIRYADRIIEILDGRIVGDSRPDTGAPPPASAERVPDPRNGKGSSHSNRPAGRGRKKRR